MAEVLLFHHVQGLTDGIKAFASELSAAGHTVHTPDLFEGRTFGAIAEGMAYVKSVGFGEIAARGVKAAADLPAELVYAGFSLGVVPAQQLAQTRPQAKGALFFDSALPIEEFGTWPQGLPVQIHAMAQDEFYLEDADAAKALVAEGGELFLYDGDQHLFADSSLPSYDEQAAKLVLERVLNFLGRS
ncbi:dienelactone hydrolase family protein [Kribbella italica]|uniref:Dienelactone hydrolase n=1 Tax=Kribbella italica TaxID=1540520 RepID=A0A7W9MVU9_9ACTN|nr:dienelactone hydrolase family protein [Kribbella italica]MBB5837600.1 dienelactone hydrolase [Kribbella italica]